MYDEDDLLPVSALQHLAFCPRQCALIHVEGLWDDNQLTVEGSLFHDRVHQQESESRGDVRIARGVALRSLRLGLVGKADVVEFHRSEHGPGVPIRGAPGLWLPFPVEYKRGRPKRNPCDEIQLCAQAICLEEMLGIAIPDGALFYGRTRRRKDVHFHADLRSQTESTARQLHELIDAGRTPAPDPGPKCDRCSLAKLCIPRAASRGSATTYIRNMLHQEDK